MLGEAVVLRTFELHNNPNANIYEPTYRDDNDRIIKFELLDTIFAGSFLIKRCTQVLGRTKS